MRAAHPTAPLGSDSTDPAHPLVRSRAGPTRLIVEVLPDPPSDRVLDDRIGVSEAAQARLHTDETGVERRAGRARLEVRLDRCSGVNVELTIEIRRDMSARSPASKRLGEACLTSLVALGEGTDQHHPSPPEPLLGRREAGLHGSADLPGRPAEDVVEDDRYPIDDRQARERVFELVAKLCAFEDPIGSDRIAVVTPIRLDGFDIEFGVMRSRPVDDPVDETAPEPGRERCRIPKLVSATPSADDRLLGAVLGLVRVADESGREPDQSREFADERVRERITAGLAIDGQLDQFNLQGP